MQEITNDHSALTAYRRQTAVDPVAASEAPVEAQGAPSEPPAEEEEERVAISPAQAPAEDDGAIDRRKIEQLKKAIRSGTLRFDSKLVAERMVDQDE